eukprot:CAMPEP_0201726872 /NCGR_PEP_ID=MMETSP0593-20130828/10494_1 /ASSEMBLY_ACC=CAM_ASM_000672 /TAXON_ID=267983 /ORGANISM="Skeletonema japonicum, Strain CCMP2506" /LENGTH=440 /DNA_ID=CAMNT_0048218455 /DNA_START=20 /DNA_END=1342 /DNA_ORIENTATION=+
MASSFGSYAQRSIKPTAAIAAGALSATVFNRSSKQTQNEIEDNTQQKNVTSTLTGFHVLRNNNSSIFSWHTPSGFSLNRNNATALCEAASNPAEKTAPYKPSDPAEPIADASNNEEKTTKPKGGMWGEEEDGLFHGLFPRRQLWRPHVEYPLWHADWDGRQPLPVESDDKDESARLTAQRDRQIRKNGVTKHIILIRHGQYDETHKEDEKRLLTPLGREQAAMTGKRLGQLIRGVNEDFGPCKVKVVRVSNLARAKETADIIYDNMDLDNFDGGIVERADPDPLLNEGRPCHHIPGGKARPSVVERTDEHHPRIEEAFNKYFHRAPMPEMPPSAAENKKETIIATASTRDSNEGENEEKLVADPKHEFEVIVCHANVIRYFFCRALQLPPEAWLRLCTFNCSLTYFTIRPTGTVSCRMLGDIGHLPHDMSTFSMHTGFNW